MDLPTPSAPDSSKKEPIKSIEPKKFKASASTAAVSRRDLLKLGTGAVAAYALLNRSTATAKDATAEFDEAGMALRPAVTPFVEQLPMPKIKQAVDPNSMMPPPNKVPVVGECGRPDHQFWTGHEPKKGYYLDVMAGTHSFHKELPNQTIWGYDGTVPGPTFVAYYGEPIMVRIRNKLPSSADHIGYGSPEISTHLHNLHGPSESDGFPGDWYSKEKYGPTMTGPGEFKDHHYPNCYADHEKYPSTDGEPREALGTLWYHDHRMDFTAPNVYKGLAGFYLLFDHIDSNNENAPPENKTALRLPSGVGVFDIPLVFQDKKFDSSGNLQFDQFNTDGMLGNKICVNGKIQPYFSVKRRKYRFRLLNGSSSRFYEFYLSTKSGDQSFSYIANDGNLLEKPLTMKKVRLAPAERGDIVIDFAKYPVGTKLYLVNRLLQTDGRGPKETLSSGGPQVLRFDVDQDWVGEDPSRIPDKLREQPPINLNEVVKTRIWEFDRNNSTWSVNGQLFDVTKPAALIKRGTAEIWVFRGKGGWWHPIHVHATEGRILSRNGREPPEHERGRKDVYPLGEGEEIRVYLRFTDFIGKYIMHCHNTVHEDHAMMVRWDVVP